MTIESYIEKDCNSKISEHFYCQVLGEDGKCVFKGELKKLKHDALYHVDCKAMEAKFDKLIFIL